MWRYKNSAKKDNNKISSYDCMDTGGRATQEQLPKEKTKPSALSYRGLSGYFFILKRSDKNLIIIPTLFFF
jgi:hypothetical protein